MAVDLFTAGEVLVLVKGAAGSAIAGVQQLGYCESSPTWNPVYENLDVIINAYGQTPAEVQTMGKTATLSIPLVYFDPAILDALCSESSAGAGSPGANSYAGKRMGGGGALYSSTCHFFSVCFTSPVAGKPFTFLACHLVGQPINFPVGAERSVVQVNLRAISYSPTPTSLAGVVCWNNSLLT
jgi:hypothetical protein